MHALRSMDAASHVTERGAFGGWRYSVPTAPFDLITWARGDREGKDVKYGWKHGSCVVKTVSTQRSRAYTGRHSLLQCSLAHVDGTMHPI